MRAILIAGVLFLTALTFYSALWFKSETIEDDITKRVTADLDASGAKNVDVDVDGRHVTLTGVVFDETVETAYLDTADNTYGALGPIDGLTYQTDGSYVTATKTDDGITLRGTVPSEDARADLVGRANAATDGTVTDALTIGGASSDWQAEAGFGLDKMAGLTSGALAVSAGSYVLSGTAGGDASDINGTLANRTGWSSFVSDDMSGKVADLTANVADRDQTIAGFQADLDALRSVVGEEQADAATLTQQLGDANDEIAARDVTIADMTSAAAALESNVTDLTATVATRDATIVDLQGQLTANASDAEAASAAKIADLSGTIAAKDAELADLSGLVETRDATIVDLQGQLTANASDAEAASAAKIADLSGMIAAKDAELADLSGLVETRDATITDLQGQLSANASDLDTANAAKIAALTAAAAAQTADVARLSGDVEGLTAQVADRDTTIESLQGQLDTAGANADQIADLKGVIAERDATIAAFAATPASSGADIAAQCARQATSVLEGSRINFATGTATIEAGSVALLERVTGIALACVGDNVSVEVGGHTDDRGSDESNQQLSEQRAQAVRDFMAARGVNTSGLAAVGYGEANPIADNATAEGRAANRRISFDWQAR